ncbi:MAG: nitroreductase family deazaflavin-dependent oxidoreductase [Anaerolineales bacterium]
MNLFYKFVIGIHMALYKVSRGVIGGSMVNLDVLLLTTTGRISGKPRTTPLGFFREGDDYVLIASNGGSDSHPKWLFNLKNNPNVRIRIKDKEFSAIARQATLEHRNHLWARLLQLSPWYDRYAKRTQRVIPLVLLHPELSG